MDFFKSMFVADPTSPREEKSPAESPHGEPDDDERGTDIADAGGGGGGDSSIWGGFVRTFASKSESVIETYRRDLEEFRTGLKKETEAFREAAARAVLDLPGSLEVSASVAQESLESVGHAIDDFGGSVWRGTADIISQGREAILSMEAEGGGTDHYASDHGTPSDAASSRRYSRFEAQVLAIQSDPNTFSVEPEDAQDFNNWRSGFDLADKEDEIERLCYENSTLEGFIEKLVPRTVDYETFWCRYYYRVHKLQQAEDARAKLVKRVIAVKEEEDLSWEVDDDDEENLEVKKDDRKAESSTEGKENIVEEKKDETEKVEQEDHMNDKPVGVEKQVEVSQLKNLEASVKQKDEGVTSDERRTNEPKKEVQKEAMNSEPAGEEQQAEASQVEELEASTIKIDDGVTSNAGKVVENTEISNVGMNSKLDDKTEQEGKTEANGSSMDAKSSTVSSQPSKQAEEDLEWDEIENFSDNDEKKPGESSANPPKVDFHKRLSAVDDEDLSWDIEDDD